MRVQERTGQLWIPRYSFADADYLAHVSRGTSKRWLAGYSYVDSRQRRVRRPPVTPRPGEQNAVSFLDLVEIVAIGRLKEFGMSLALIRRIVTSSQELFNAERPLVTMKFKMGGREVFVEAGGLLTEVGHRKGLRAWSEIVDPFLRELEYSEDGLARRWWPLGLGNVIVVDPEYAFGFPVVRNSGVRTETILERFQAGDLKDEIASDFNVDPMEVERALQFELSRAA